MPTADAVRAAFSRYVEAWERRDRDGFLACFLPDAVQIDPYPSEPNVGVEAIGAFFDRTTAMTETMTFMVGHTIVGGDTGVFPFTVRSRVGGVEVEVDAVDLVQVADDGRIRSITAYVDTDGMRTVSG